MEIVYFTGGTVGAGHLVRGVALGRALSRRGFRGRYRMLGPALDFPVAAAAGYEAVAIDASALVDARRAPETALGRRLSELAPDVLVVDMFWALAQHVVPHLGCETWLLARAAPDDWLVGPREIPFEARAWTRVVGIEPLAPSGVRERIPPLVVANPDELEPAGSLRALLGVAVGEPLEVAIHAGKSGELEELVALSPLARAIDLRSSSAPFPAALWLGDADRVISGAGYNAFWESRWLGWYERSRFVPFARKIDRQDERLRRCAATKMAENGADVLAAMLDR